MVTIVRSAWLALALVPLGVALGCQLLAGIDPKSSTVGAASDGGGECASNQECIARNGGNPAICRRPEGTCKAVLSPDCPRLLGSVTDDNTILFGLVQDLRGSNAGTGMARMQSAELAVTEITETVRGVPGGADGRPRPIAIVACSENRDLTSPADPTAPGKFLANDLRVPAIIGAGNSGTTIDLATNVTIPSGVLLFSPSATSEALTTLEDDNLVWRTAPSNTVQAIALRLQVSALEASVRAATGAATVKLAVVVKGDTFGTGLWGLTEQGLRLNGIAANDPSNTPNLLVREYPAAATTSELATIAANVLSFGPHIVLSIGTGEAVTGILDPVESNWVAGNPTQSPPEWLFTNGGQATPLLDAAGAETGDLRARVRGTVPGSRGALYDAFVLRYDAVYANGPAVTFGAAGAYDIVYLLAYASLAAPPSTPPFAPLTGHRLVAGLLDVVAGSAASATIAVGPSDLNRGFQLLASGNKIKFTGASGPLDFDVTTGEAPSDIDIWCIPQHGPAVFRSSGLYYSASAQSLVGTFSCPND